MHIRGPKDRAPIASLEDWRTHASPRGGASQWAAKRSALELARAWCPEGAPPAVPGELSALLDSHPDLGGLVIGEVTPERKVRFDRLRGEPRNADLVMVGEGGAERVAVSVEAKADEPFDRTIGAVREAVERKKARGIASRGVVRIEKLLRALVPDMEQEATDVLRYQLFTAAAGALVFAREVGAARAVLVVHEFVSDPGSRKVRRNARDLDAFVAALARTPGATVDPGTMFGPIRVPGSDNIPLDIPLYIGKARRMVGS